MAHTVLLIYDGLAAKFIVPCDCKHKTIQFELDEGDGLETIEKLEALGESDLAAIFRKMYGKGNITLRHVGDGIYRE